MKEHEEGCLVIQRRKDSLFLFSIRRVLDTPTLTRSLNIAVTPDKGWWPGRKARRGIRVAHTPGYACGAFSPLLPSSTSSVFIRTIRTFPDLLRLSVNPFFSSACGCPTLRF